MSNVTIYTDASFHPVTKQAGWAAYVRCKNARVKAYGLVDETCPHIGHAELYAIAKGIAIAYSIAPNETTYYINSDNLQAVQALAGQRSYKSVECQALLTRMQAWLAAQSITVVARHVKAHTGEKDVRSWINHWADKQSKYARRSGHKSVVIERFDKLE